MKLTKSQKKRLRSVISGTFFFLCGIAFSLFDFSISEILASVSFTLGGVCAGLMCFIRAVKGISRGEIFDENTLMTLAAIGAVVIGEYPECAAVMILYQVGELFQSIAVGKSRRAISELAKLCPDTAWVLENGGFVEKSASEVKVGQRIRIRAGERIPLDARIVKGTTTVDTSPVTGESVPRDAAPGTDVFAGCVNMSGLIEAEVVKPQSESTAAKILFLTETASERKTRSEAFITRFAKVYTPLVALASILTAFAVPLFILLIEGTPYLESLAEWGRRSLSMLVISCPCALVISVPLGYFCGIGAASKRGILIKGSAYMDALALTDTAVFDKTGTLTSGELSVVGVSDTDISEERLLSFAAGAEKNSSHPIAKAICNAAKARSIASPEVMSVTETAGNGVTAILNDGTEVSVRRPVSPLEKTAVSVFVNGKFSGNILLSDTVKPSAKESVAALRRLGIGKTVMLTGDSARSAEEVARYVGIDEVKSGLLPEDKYKNVEKLSGEGSVIYVGDGINDTPSLARADVGVAMGALGTEAAMESADVVLMTKDLSALVFAKKLAKKTLLTVRANIAFSLAVKAAVLVLAALDLVGMWAAVLADVGVCIICVTNSVRLGLFKKNGTQ